MSVSAESLGIKDLPQKDKIALIDELWADVVNSAEAIPLSPELCAELDRRIAAYEADPVSALTWEEVRESVRLKIGE